MEKQITAAMQAWLKARESELHAKSIGFNSKEMQYTIALSNGILLIFPVKAIRELSNAQLDQLLDVHLSGNGDSIHWESLGVDFSIPGLIHRLVGGKS